MEEIVALVGVIMGFSVPLSIIGGVIYLRAQKLKLKQFTSDERNVLLELKSENAELKKRLENLETIVSSNDDDALLESARAQRLNPPSSH